MLDYPRIPENLLPHTLTDSNPIHRVYSACLLQHAYIDTTDLLLADMMGYIVLAGKVGLLDQFSK